MSNAHGVARDQLRAFIERIERLEEEKKTIADDIKDVYAEAKGMGFIPAMMKKVIALRKKDEQERAEEEAILDTYLHALGMIAQPDLFEEPHHPETGEIIDPKLAQTIVTGMQTETGRKALIAAVDIMITREEAEEQNSPAMALQSPRKAAEAVSERTAFTSATEAPVLVEADEAEAVAEVLGKPETISALTVQHDGVNVGGPEREGVTVVGTESGTVASPKVLDGRSGDGPESRHHTVVSRDEAGQTLTGNPIPEIDPSEDRSEGHSLGGDAGANAGGDHEVDVQPAATLNNRLGGKSVQPVKKPLRPHCRNPGEHCGGYGSTHCASCLKAAKQAEVAA